MAYPTWRQLSDEVKAIIDNASWDVTAIEPIINQVYVGVCEHERVHLPDLETSSALTSSTTLSYIALPTDIQTGRKRALFGCKNATQNHVPVPVYSSVSVLRSKFSGYDQVGTIQGCAVRGGFLHYQRIPEAAESLIVSYWKKATVLTAPDSSTPILIPSEDIARRILIHGTCKEIFPRIYQDAPQTHPMVVWSTGEYNKALAELISLVGPWDMGFDSFSG